MKLTPEIVRLAPAALIIGFVLGYRLRSFVSFLRHRRLWRERYSIQSGQERRMEAQCGNQDWRVELERELSEIIAAPTDVPQVCPEDASLVPADSAPELRAEAKELYGQALHIGNDNDRIAVLSRWLELELTAETDVIVRRTRSDGDKA
jgi:hypothetical protein